MYIHDEDSVSKLKTIQYVDIESDDEFKKVNHFIITFLSV